MGAKDAGDHQYERGAHDQVDNEFPYRSADGGIREQGIAENFKSIKASAQPLESWSDSFKQKLEPELAATRSLRDVRAARPLVLVVDDDEFQHKAVKAALGSAPLDLAFAASAIEAFAQIRNRPPSVILLDYQMPDLSGIEMLKRLRASTEFATVPVSMLTGNNDKEVVRTSFNAGANDFIIKPYQRKVLIKKLTDQLRDSVLGSAPPA